ncbi:MAG: N-acetyl-gamma-glutamyl-phosphate reductase [Cyclobacteriaceae bacterium]
MINAGIIGGAGYTGGELIRLLLNHPEVELNFIQSQSQAGKPVTAVHTDLMGEVEMTFSSNVTVDVDVLFLCQGHGKAKEFFQKQDIPSSIKVVDLSHDFRISDDSHSFTYGLPELQKDVIKNADKIANPGCFATAITLGLLPLAARGLLKKPAHINAITGATGAGQSLSSTSHFSWRNNNVSVYKPFQHQHLAEIGQSLQQANGATIPDLNFIPVRGNFSRGIFASLYTETDMDQNEALELYQDFYSAHPFTWVSDQNPSLKEVVNTNKCLLYLEKHGRQLLIVSVIDNLLKGAVGQAVQNMNLMFGLDETTGLKLKAIGF